MRNSAWIPTGRLVNPGCCVLVTACSAALLIYLQMEDGNGETGHNGSVGSTKRPRLSSNF